MGLTRVLGGILLFTALYVYNPGQALSAVLPPGHSVSLAWTPSADPTVAGYRVYYGVASRSYTNIVDAGNTTSATISGLIEGTTYYFAATAYDTLGLESDYSDEASYTVPSIALPTVQIRVMTNRQAVLTVKGLVGHTYDILATQTLTAWTVLGTVTLGAGGSVDFTDTNAPSFPKRFYRTHDTQP